MASRIGNIYIRIGADTKSLDRDLKAVQKQISAFGNQMKSAGAELSQTITLPLVGIGVAAVKSFSDLEALQKGLISVMGSSEAAGKEFEKLKEVAKLPGLGLEEAVRGSVNLQAAGFSADEARNSLLQFGNALATVGKGKNELNLVVLALTQLQNKTSGFGQDLRQLVEQLPQLRGALTNAFGTADSEAIAKLGVTGKQVVELLTTEFAKLPRVSGGVKNAFENLTDSTKVAFSKLGETLNKTLNIEGFLNRLGDLITRLTDRFNSLSPATQKIIITFAGVAAAIGPVLFIAGQLATSFSAIIAAMKTAGLAATVSLGPIGVAVAAIAAAVTILIVKWDDIKETMDQVGISSIDLSGAFEILTGILKTGLTVIRLVVDYLGNLLGTYLRFSAAVAGKITWTEFAKTTVDAFKETGTNAINGFVDAVNTGAKKISLNIAGSTSGNDRAKLFEKLRQGTGGTSIAIGGSGKGKTKKVDQFSALDEQAKIAAGLFEIPNVNFTPELPRFNEPIQAMEVIIQKSIKSTKDLKYEMLELGRDMNKIFVNPDFETFEQKMGKLAEKLAVIGQIAQQAFSVFDGIFQRQIDSINAKEAREKAAVENSVLSEEQKKKKLLDIDQKYDAEQKKIKRRQAIAQKVAGVFAATISLFEGIARTLALGPAGVPLLPYIKALGIANIAAVAAAPLPSLEIGTNRVKSDGLAKIHKGEAIVPAKVAEGGFNGFANNVIEVIGKISGTDIIIGQKNSSELYNRMYA